MTRAVEANPSADVHFYCSSGGNAGLACATSALSLGRRATIVIPTLTKPLMKRKLQALGVEVHQVGDNWPQADRYLREELLAKDPHGVYVPPFDHPDIWDGASSIVTELREQMRHQPIHGIVCSVGGGGLLNGIMQGIDTTVSWAADIKPRVLAVETIGADSLHASVVAGQHVTIPGITSIATSLGATRVSEKTWAWTQQCPDVLESLVVSDADAAVSCVRFADDARILVEPACGATLAVAYNGELRQRLGKGLSDEEWAMRNVVLEVCGGSGVTLDILADYREKYASESSIKS
jgi:L-serine/L-threonine ammonia-lyase